MTHKAFQSIAITKRAAKTNLTAFAGDQDGAVTVWAVGWSIIFLIVGGLAIDAGNAWKEKSMLQATADAAALAGAIELSPVQDEDARAEAIRVANLNLNGNILVDSDIVSGMWSFDTRSVDTDATLKDAVQVTTRKTQSQQNAVPTFILKMVGFGSWDVSARATAQRFIPGCIREGLIARDRVEVSSNNDFIEGICLHGQQGVKISSNNFFEDGVKVTMPDLSTLQIPNSGFESNIGLEQALGEDWIDPKIVDHISEIVSSLANPTSDRQPVYIDPYLPAIPMNRSQFNSAQSFTPGRVYNVACGGGQSIDVSKNLHHVVVTTNCRVSFGDGVSMTESIFATSNTGTSSMTGNADTVIGADDNCSPGGGAQLVSAGQMHFAGRMQLYGSQLIAAGDISLAAQSDGIEGASIQSGGSISLTSLSSFGFCNDDVDQVLYQDYYRLVG